VHQEVETLERDAVICNTILAGFVEYAWEADVLTCGPALHQPKIDFVNLHAVQAGNSQIAYA